MAPPARTCRYALAGGARSHLSELGASARRTDVTTHVPDVEPWIHPILEVRESAVAERGLIARESLCVGERVIRFGGRIVTDEQLANILGVSRTSGRGVVGRQGG
jgi:hypothetical protein